jgi:branched-chain amino acid transport system substrate-binding protein
MRKFFAASSLVAIALSACGQTQDSGPIKIGFIGPLTGDAAAYGVDTLNGVKMQVEQINAAGGISGRMVELVAEDGKCAGADAATAAQKLVNVDKVVAIIGGQCSGETLAAAPIVNAAMVPMISALSSSPDVTAAGEFVFRDYPSDALKTKAMAAYFKEKGFGKIAAISENTDFAVGFRDSLMKDAGADAFVFNEVVEPGTKDYRSLVTRLKDVQFDVLLANGQYPSSIAVMVQQLREQGIKSLAITHDVGHTAEVLKLAKDAAEGLLAINVPSMSDASEFGKAYIAKNGPAQGAIVYAAFAYDAMGVLAQVIASVGTDGTAIKDALLALPSYEGVVGTFGFDANGDVEGVNYKLFEVQKGEWVELKDVAVK